ncbi:SIR2 family protein [Pectinatus brassicae]|uniref:SIR2-like domain-containing protein n=1 Tax=Pectinatus brassicae TaxID=862415 RepID=A0A840UPI0_9FIRM|nr:SIR2 family protein [Pectinatus brassicae]MBB5336112.1 hypothetical protein [Pectinatus brassicae]
MSTSEVSIFDILRDANEFPILFIGAGLSKRYIVDYPSWEELLNALWKLQSDGHDFFAELNKLKKDILTKKPTLQEDALRFELNTEAAQIIGKNIDNLFFDEKLPIDGLSQEMAFRENLSPFKKYLSNNFSRLQIKNEPTIQTELEAFQKLLLKTRLIFTTNYDNFIETSYNQNNHSIATYIGQNGLFQATLGYAELFKIHGCISEPNSLVLTKDDYLTFEKHSVLISAKIISEMLHSPIIFLGYSLTDENIRHILKSFISSLGNHEKTQLRQKLIIIQYDESAGDNIHENVIFSDDFQCFFTLIKTNNYSSIYNKLAEIDQGVTPIELRRYQHVIKDLIVTKGQKGSLDKIFMGIKDLPTDPEELCSQNWVVSVGKETEITIPTLKNYIKDYVTNKEIDITIALRFILTLNGNYPKLKYLTQTNIENSELETFEKTRLLKRLPLTDTIANIISHPGTLISTDLQATITSIMSANDTIQKKDATVCRYIQRFNLNDVRSYILYSLERQPNEQQLSTAFRKLSVAYDLLTN